MEVFIITEEANNQIKKLMLEDNTVTDNHFLQVAVTGLIGIVGGYFGAKSVDKNSEEEK